MTPADIQLIERETDSKLPQHYVELVTNYPRELLRTDAPSHELLNEPLEVIAENLDVRRNGYFGEKWPTQYFIIGRNGFGDYWVIKPQDTKFAVGFSDHEAMRCDKWADTREEFVAKLLQEYQSDDAA